MKYVVAVYVVVVLAIAGWRIVAPNVVNVELQDDVRDTAAQMAWYTGFADPKSDDELRSTVIGDAKKRGIVLVPEQITVRHVGTEQRPLWYIAVDYRAKVDLFVYSFAWHFKPASRGEGRFWGRLAAYEPPPPIPTKAVVKPSSRPPDKKGETEDSSGSPKTLEYKDIPQSLKRPQ